MLLQEEITVGNLKCEGCVSIIRKTLMQLGGVESVEVDMKTSEIKICFVGVLTRGDFVRKLVKLGLMEVGTSNTYQKVKSCVKGERGMMSAN